MTGDVAAGAPDAAPGDRPDQGADGLAARLAVLAGRRPLLVALDFDGVCAPIVDDPSTSRMLPGTRAALDRLGAAGCRVALVSGRSLSGLTAVAQAEPGWLLVGGHGAEVAGDVAAGPGAGGGSGPTDAAAAGGPVDDLPVDPDAGLQAVALLDEDQAALLAEITAEVEAVVEGTEGAWAEHKPTAVVLHTRLADPETTLHTTETVLEGPGSRPGVHVKPGKDVVELTVLAADKGTALRGLRERTGAAAVLYVGDDVTDEDAFRVLDPAAGDVGVKVGPGSTAAAHRVGAPSDVTALLERLVDLLRA